MTKLDLFVATRASQAALLPVVLIASFINEAHPIPIIKINFEDTALLTRDEKSIIHFQTGDKSVAGTIPIIQELCAQFPFLENKWISQLDSYDTLEFKALDPMLQHIDTHLLLQSFLSGYSLSTPDIALWGAIRGKRVAVAALKRDTLVNLTRWYKLLEELCPWATSAVESLNATSREKKLAKSKDNASYDIFLKNTENGVVTRFLPKPSFDDTNPSNEKQEFEDVIVEDFALMDIQPDKVSYTSDYFGQLYEYCLQAIKSGKAYADDIGKETMENQRWDGLRWCIRAKISFDDNNTALRDPVIYQCNPSTHHRTGDAWVIYPTYDFACPIVDSMEGVTHALRTIEYRDRNAQYQWIFDALSFHAVQVCVKQGTSKNVTWQSNEGQTLVPVELFDFNYLLKKDSLSECDILDDFLDFNKEFRVSALADRNISEVNVDDILQFDRRIGFCSWYAVRLLQHPYRKAEVDVQ
ncbi:hypothetical protein PENVUL_c002G08491 [Penicillium vulpinum]|uniref:Uncharacterized protein n=1 Tax=Penicillium vulpinum TaxID=29845 RepID=A0A1V6SBU2_9EURO|nr:hypothetical protein PENVUL_c002G08491 [Penicillium vulpinum]